MQEYEETEVEERGLPCTNPDCGSSDAMSLYSDGHTYCFSCQTRTKGNGKGITMRGNSRGSSKKSQPLITGESLILDTLQARLISVETCKKYHYYLSKDRGKPVQVACYIEDNEIVGQKIRYKDKSFMTFGSINDIFFGQHLFKGGGKKLIVTEGEIDCLTVSQVFGNKYPVVSIPKGASSAKKTFKAQLKWLMLFEEVVVIFDMDEAGRQAVKDIHGILPHGKLKIAELPLKDPNDMLRADRSEELVRAVWSAQTYTPEGIVKGKDLYNKIRERRELAQGIDLPWDIPLNKKIKGIRPAEITLLTAGSGIGKSTILRAIGHHLGVKHNIKIGCLFLEETPAQTGEKFMSIEAQKPLHLTDDTSEETYQELFKKTLGTDNFVFYDHFGSVEGDTLLNQMRYLAVSEECKYLLLDHISIAVSGLEGENERRIIDKLMTDLAVLTQETGVGIIVISHLRKTDGKSKSHEEGGKITLDDLRGSGALKQLSFNVIGLERNQQEENEKMKNLVRVKVLKCRFTGDTGYAGYLYYNPETDCLEAVPDVNVFLGVDSEGFSEEQSEF